MHLCLLAVIAVQVLAFAKSFGLDAYVYPTIESHNPPYIADNLAFGLYFTINAVLDYFAFVVMLHVNTKASLQLAGVFVASIGLHFAGFIGFRSEIMHSMYPYLANALLLAELLILGGGYNNARLDVNSHRDFISIYNRGNETKGGNSSKAGKT